MTLYTVEFEGRRVTLSQLAKLTGINVTTLQSRHREGDRGARLVRPVHSKEADPQSRSHANADIEASKQNRTFRQLKEGERLQRAREIRERNERRRKEAIDAHKRAFSEPLIAKELLSEREREEIRAKVVGRQRWFSMSGI